ncbi:hypothetical protein ACFSHQ_14425 [Gemmobacter lanyuensis]
MGDHYADILLDCLDGGLSFIGGNCQGVGVAAQLTARWSLAGRTCKSFIALEVEPSFPLPCPVALLFGAESELFNPYLRGEEHSAKLRWERMFPRPAAHIVPGGMEPILHPAVWKHWSALSKAFVLQLRTAHRLTRPASA